MSVWIISANVKHLKRRFLTSRIPKCHPDRPALKDTLAATTYYSNPERRLYGKEVGEKIQDALKTLSEKERLVFELRHYQGLQAEDDWRDHGQHRRNRQELSISSNSKIESVFDERMNCREYQHQITLLLYEELPDRDQAGIGGSPSSMCVPARTSTSRRKRMHSVLAEDAVGMGFSIRSAGGIPPIACR